MISSLPAAFFLAALPAVGAQQYSKSSQGSSSSGSQSGGSSYGQGSSYSTQSSSPSSSGAAQEAPAEVVGGSFRSSRYEAEKSGQQGAQDKAEESKREPFAEPLPPQEAMSLGDAWHNYRTVLGIYLSRNGLKLRGLDKSSFTETAPGRYRAVVRFQSKNSKTIREAEITADLSGPSWDVTKVELKKSRKGRP
ncbi:MAG: hypothetical protein HY921_02475 [Elusimicrobia bacterium]|nr:hypothetical protein [Elusimicrobiota bacterium]